MSGPDTLRFPNELAHYPVAGAESVAVSDLRNPGPQPCGLPKLRPPYLPCATSTNSVRSRRGARDIRTITGDLYNSCLNRVRGDSVLPAEPSGGS